MLAERVRWGDSLEDSLLDVIHPASLGFMELNKFRYLVSTSLFSLRSRWCFIYDPSHCTRTRISIKQHIKQAPKSHVQIWMKGARQITPNPAMIRSANPDIVSWQCPNLTAQGNRQQQAITINPHTFTSNTPMKGLPKGSWCWQDCLRLFEPRGSTSHAAQTFPIFSVVSLCSSCTARVDHSTLLTKKNHIEFDGRIISPPPF